MQQTWLLSILLFTAVPSFAMDEERFESEEEVPAIERISGWFEKKKSNLIVQ